MTISNSIGSYADCFEVMDKALLDPIGYRLRLPTQAEANFLRMRMHQARKLDRDKNARIYTDPGHHLHNTSEYDQLTLRIRYSDGSWYLDLERQSLAILEQVPLSEVPSIVFESPPKVELRHMLRLEGPKETEGQPLNELKRRV